MFAEAELRALCHRVVIHIIQDNDWHLLGEDEYVHRVYAEAITQQVETEPQLNRICLTIYSLAMYHACQPAQSHAGTGRYERAHRELHAYLNKRTHRKWPGWPRDDVQEVVQSATTRVFQSLRDGAIHSPAAFLKYAEDQVRGATTAIKRGSQKGGQPITSLDQSMPEPASERSEDDASFDAPDHVAEQHQFDEAVVTEVRRKFVIHPKAELQLRAAILRLAFGQDNEEISRQLGVPSSQVSTLVWRGKQKFSQNRELRALYVELFTQMM